ncbi:hypothetical protein GINT2_000471 [Glugoides intestinalis]
MLSVETNGPARTCNHLLFIDDLKLLAKDEKVLKLMVEETMEFLDTVGLEHNREKSATNAKTCENAGVFLEGPASYKYLGISEDSTGKPTRDAFKKVKAEILKN